MQSKNVFVSNGLNEQVDEVVKTKDFRNKNITGIPLSCYTFYSIFHYKTMSHEMNIWENVSIEAA